MHVLNLFLTLFSLLVGIGRVHADSIEPADSTPAIVNHIKEIQNLTAEMALVVQNWNGDILDALAIRSASSSLIEAIETGTETATQSKKMSVRKAIKVKRATKKLVEVTRSSLNTITDSKLLFDHAGLTSTMISRLEKTREAADTLIAAIVDKLPRVGKRIGRKLGRQIATAFDSAIAEFSDEPGEN
ncbi:hydrophobic surface binding protein A-domain-containing protein [Diaporthe sp. PMI_573]|nr:hydrophobic surface binding protein A-domain-containing protein [Diaporthaceae sp. PMI_573]